MSIAQAANIVRAQGRNGDTELMHVTPGEVKALQGLAQMHGGSLTRNPQTGLPEASFLQNILPTLAGVAVGTMTANPFLGAAVAGGIGYGTSGSLEKGMLSGLGAFGGASALTSLGGVGATTAGLAGAGGAGGAAGTAGSALSTSIGSGAAGAGAGIGGSTIPSVAQLGAQASGQLASSAPSLAAMTSPGAGLGPTLQAAQTGTLATGASSLTPAQQFAALSTGDKFSALGTGFSNLFSDPSGTFSAMGGLKGQGMNLAMAGAPLLMGDDSSAGSAPEPQGDIRQSDWDPVGRRFVRRPVVSARDYRAPQRSVFAYQEGGEVDANRSQIARFYREYLGREPDQAGLDYFADQISQGAMSMVDVQQALQQSPESMTRRRGSDIESFYRDYLGRAPEEEGRASWMQSMEAGATPEQVQQAIMASPEAAGIRAAAQQRTQAFSPMPQAPMTPEMGATPQQQMGIGMIPNRYQAPVNVPSQGVQDFNQMLANRAAYEYGAMPMPDAMRPRSPQEMQAIRDRQLLGQQMRAQDALQAAPAAAAAPASDALTRQDVQEMILQGSEPQNFNYAQGGIAALPKTANIPSFQAGGDMENSSFIVPADVVSALGNGSTEAGVEVLNQYLGMAMPIEGAGDGLSDDIPATIEGEQPARVADGEVYIPAEVVAMIGQGDPERGAAKLYAMMDKIREQAHGSTEQQAEVNPEEVMPV